MPPDDSRYWFPAKRYGWGWGLPATWEGWAVMAGFFRLGYRRHLPRAAATINGRICGLYHRADGDPDRDLLVERRTAEMALGRRSLTEARSRGDPFILSN